MPLHSTNVEELAGAVMALVQLINRGQARAYDVELVAVMQLLLRAGHLPPSEIARQLEVPRSSVTGRVKILRESGWVEVRPDPDDGRSYLAGLTRAGEQQMSRLTVEGLEIFTAWTSDWSDEEIEAFTRLTRRLTGQAPPPPPAAAQSRRDPWWRQDASGPAEP
jgi:DNA-binding MarR family transcriptional regulator